MWLEQYKFCNKYREQIFKKLITGPNLDLVSGRDLDRVHVGICENHTSKIDLDSGRDLVHFGPNLFGSQMTPIFVILVADLSFLPTSHTTQAQLRSPYFRQMPPKATTKTKKWGQSDKDSLHNLVQARLIDIEDLSLDNIDTVHQEHFRHHAVKNFCHNYKDFSVAFDLEAKYCGAGHNKGGEGKLRCMILIIICARIL
jgi:hypothetical protein